MRDVLRAKRRQFVFDPLFNRETKPRSDVGGSGGFENDCGSIVLDLSEFRKKILGIARRKHVAVI